MTNRQDSDPTIYHSRDGRLNWQTYGWVLKMGKGAREIMSAAFHAGRIWVVGGKGYIFVSQDGVEWTMDHSLTVWDDRNPGVYFYRGTALAGFGDALWIVTRGEIYRYR